MVDLVYCTILCISLCLICGNCYNFYPEFEDDDLFRLPDPENGWQNYELPKDEWLDQKLDHFDPTNRKTWKQRYFANNKYYKSGGPVFLHIFGESKAHSGWLVVGQTAECAKIHDALVVGVEHRYYGKSHPTEDISMENLKFLSSQQALGDLAVFRNYIMEKTKLPTGTKWVSFGGSYPGALAAWFRLKYPHLVHASIASSAPIYAVVDFKEYLHVVKDSLETTGPSCTQRISEATESLNNLMKNNSGILYLKKLFRVCKYLDLIGEDNVRNFFVVLISNFENVVQYNQNRGASPLGNKINMDTLCSIMNNRSLGSPLKRYAYINSLILNAYKRICIKCSYLNLINYLKGTLWSSWAANRHRQWLYQKCNEFGFFKSTDSEKQPFGHHIPEEFLIKKCTDVFGEDFNGTRVRHSVNRTNTYYGGKSLKVTRVMFINGSFDPWKAVSITKSSSKEVSALLINDTAHCANMFPSYPNDPPQLKEAREIIRSQISNWLKD